MSKTIKQLKERSAAKIAKIANYTIDYKYPENLDLSPNSTLHGEILGKLLEHASWSRSAIEPKFDSWREIDRTMTAFIPYDDQEALLKYENPEKPINIVIPISYTNMDTILTYYTLVLLEDPVFGYDPEEESSEAVGTMMLEQVIQRQVHKARMKLALATCLMDSVKYNLGAVSPYWTVKKGWNTVMRGLPGFRKKVRKEATLYEGNALRSIDPYNYLPDPHRPLGSSERPSYAGWVDRDSYINLLEEEVSGGDLFNVQYLDPDKIDGSSYFFDKMFTDDYRGRGDREPSGSAPGGVDVVYQYIKLVPSVWGLAERDEPEIWLFAMAADAIIISAKRLNLDHNDIPIYDCSPEADGHSLVSPSATEITYGLQNTTDFLLNSRINNIRKSSNDMIVYDPFVVNTFDIENPAPGKLIRMRRAAAGRGLVNESIKQLDIHDTTANHLQDIILMSDFSMKTTGATQMLQGGALPRSERRTATEVRQTNKGAFSRLEKSIMLIDQQLIKPLGYALAKQTQQLMSVDAYVQIHGRNEQALRRRYGTAPAAKVSPFDLLVDFDVISKSGSLKELDNPEMWMQLWQTALQSEVIGGLIDMPQLTAHVLKTFGTKNTDRFIKAQPQIVSDEAALRGAEAGNLVPLRGAT